MYERRILHHGSDPASEPSELSLRAVEGCWFELHRQGGCGSGELLLKDRFPERDAVEVGDWISLEYAAGERWYLGRVEERSADSPAGVRLRLEGMGIELNEVFPGGFAEDVDGVPPHRIGRTDLFSNDPDYALETFDFASDAVNVITLLLERYVVPATHIVHEPLLVEGPPTPAATESIKFRGEESVRSIVKQLAMAARGASWGVDAAGEFFFLQRRPEVLAVLQEGRDLTSLAETRDREHLFNRVLFTGDYVYDRRGSSDWIARRAYRFRGNYVQLDSRELHGERRIRMWIPWIRTPEDALAFVREFFREYAAPTSRFLVETAGRSELLRPWEGRVRLEGRDGSVLAVGWVETVRVLFDHVPRFRLEIGPEDPRTLWPEPPEDERWEVPEQQRAGGPVVLTDGPTSDWLTSLDSESSASSAGSEESTGSDESSGEESSGGSTGVPSSGGSSSIESSSGGSSGSDSAGSSEESSFESSGGDSSGASESEGSSGASSDVSSAASSGAESSGGESSGGSDSGESSEPESSGEESSQGESSVSSQPLSSFESSGVWSWSSSSEAPSFESSESSSLESSSS
jgi:hypothetical protein